MEAGLHCLFDGISLRLLQAEDLVRFLVRCPREIGLIIISGPHVYKTDAGLAGIVLVAESHISVHTDGLAVYWDVFSCRRFPPSVVLALASELLLIDEKPKPRVQMLKRGWGKA